MWLRFKLLMVERDVLIGLVVFGFMVMFADLLDDLALPLGAVIVRGLGLLLLVLVLIWEFGLRSRWRKPVAVPIMFTQEIDRAKARSLFEGFVQSAKLTKAVKVLERISPLQRNDLLIRLDRHNPRNSAKLDDWRAAWAELLREWEREVDKQLVGEHFAFEGRCYHVCPHLVLPLSLSLGASVGLRRSVVVYHYEPPGRFYRVLDLVKPRSLFQEADPSVPPPRSVPEDLSTLPTADKLILHLVISDRHPFQPDKHPDHAQAANAALIYKQALKPESDWLPYVQWLVQKAKPLIDQYSQVEVCLIGPSVIAFAIGMALSRTPHVTVCDWINDQYQPVFSLVEVERHLPFD